MRRVEVVALRKGLEGEVREDPAQPLGHPAVVAGIAATAEGEGDLSLADWRAAHQRYYEAEGARIGIPFTDDAEMYYEYFRILRVFRR